MLGYEEKITLTGANALNKDGKIIDYTISFPIVDTDFDIPKGVIQISIMEGQWGRQNYAYTAFKIHVGQITSISEICEKKDQKVKFYYNVVKNIKDPDDKLCYYIDDSGKYIIFARIDKGDIVVKNLHELKIVLMTISNNFKNIKDAITNIKNANNKAFYNLTNEDNELSKKRIKVCIRERNRKEDKYE